jgi:colanic acid biosynthesis glycosyl transferase WcaI
MKRLWLVSEVYYPEEISTGYYLTTIAEGLTDDHDVKVLTGQPKHMARGVVAPKHEIRNGVEIFRTWGTTLDKNVMLFRLINMATIGIGILFSSLKRFRKGDHVLVVTAPPSLPVTTTLAVLLKGASITLLVQDSYPEILEACGTIKKGGIASNVINFFNRWVYKYASRIIVMGRDMKELFEKKAAGLSVPVIPIPNWADLESVSPMPRTENKLLTELGILDKFVLLYAGNIGHPTDVETIIRAAEKLQHREEFYFVFIGSGAKKPWVENEVERLSLKNVRVLSYRPRGEQRDFLNGCDVGLVALIDGMWGTAMPSRTYNIMAAGKPVLAITEQGSELARVIDEDLTGTYVAPGDVDGFIRSLWELYSSPDDLEERGRRARAAALAKYSAATAVESYRRALSGLSDGQ